MDTQNRVADKKVRYQQIFESIQIDSRKTKIVCTMGPACWDIDMLVKMLDAGMNVARLDFAHGDHKQHANSIDNLKEALLQRPQKGCGFLMDIKGFEIKTGYLKTKDPLDIQADQNLKIVCDSKLEGDTTRIGVSFKGLPQNVKIGQTITIGDGLLTAEVNEIGEDFICVTCKNACKLGERKVLRIKGGSVDVPALTERDEEDIIEFGIKQGVDFIAISNIRKAKDLEYTRELLGPQGAHIKLVSKIQNSEALKNYDEILANSDGIMVCRSDLANDIPLEKVLIAQKWMIEKANIAATPVIACQQLLESMIKAPRPTRGEASDVLNTVVDGADGVLLSNESSNGDYPINAVSILSKVCVEAEKTMNNKRMQADVKLYTAPPLETAESVATTVVQCVQDQKDIHLIIALTDTGKLARLISKYRPEVNILACSANAHTVRQLDMVRGVMGMKVATLQGQENVIHHVIQEAKHMKLCKSGTKVAVIHATNEDTADESNVMKVLDVTD